MLVWNDSGVEQEVATTDLFVADDQPFQVVLIWDVVCSVVLYGGLWLHIIFHD